MTIYNCTSTLYHKPLATIFLIVVNIVVALIVLATSSDSVADYTLSYTGGLQPIQWITSPFIHTSLWQMLGNIVFLWIFGLLVEGKIGSGKFLVLFILMAVGASAIEQYLMSGSKAGQAEVQNATPAKPTKPTEEMTADERIKQAELERALIEYQAYQATLTSYSSGSGKQSSIGALPVIFGLLAVCIMFAPASHYLALPKSKDIEIPVVGVIVAFVIWEFVIWFFNDFGDGGPFYHLIGAGFGIVLGAVAVSSEWGEFEGEDFVSQYMTKPEQDEEEGLEVRKKSTIAERREQAAERRRDREEAARAKEELLSNPVITKTKKKSKEVKIHPLMHEVKQSLEDGDRAQAIVQLKEIHDEYLLSQLPLESYSDIYRTMASNKQWPAAILTLEKAIAAHREESGEQRLQLARLYLGLKKHDKCEAVLSKIQRSKLSSEQMNLYRQLVIKLRQSGSE